MKTKILALLLMLAMIVGVLASCGGNGDNGGDKGGNKVVFATWEKAFDLSNATIEYKNGDVTSKYWAIDDACYTEDEDGAFVETEVSFENVTNVLKTKAFYDAVTLGTDGKYTVDSYTIGGATVTDVVVTLSGKVISGYSYKANGVTVTLTATKVGTTDKPEHDRTKSYYWTENQSILIEMNLSSEKKELSALTKRYMAGMGEEGESLTSRLDTLVYDRNSAAYSTTKMSVSYVFIPDGEADWGKYHGKISNAIATPTEDTPDVYCGLAWDLGACSAKGDFVNLMSTTRGTENYFTFNEENYNADYDDEGYFYELMTSMSPVDNKMYLYASNYTLDVIRAIYCIPVSITLLESLSLEKIGEIANGYNYAWDCDGDNDWDVDDFYDMVLSKNWTFDALGILGGAAYSNDSGAAEVNFGDTLGFVHDTYAGLPSAGVMFSNDINFFTKSYDTDGTPLYNVNDTNEDFITLVNEFGDVFNYKGNFAQYAAPTGYDSMLQAIRTRFSEDKILFGGVITVGALDYTEYQSMEGGFGIVPIPLVDSSKEYVSAIHNLARVMGIAKSSTKFDQISAFLDYQALNSDDVMSNYYSLLQYDTVGGEKYNITVLNTLRNSLGDNSSQYLENQIHANKSAFSVAIDRWSKFLQTTEFDPESLRSKYDASMTAKNTALKELVVIYQGFEN